MIPFEGDTCNNLSSYRNAVERYRSFRENSEDIVEAFPSDAHQVAAILEEDVGRRIGLERDIQAALRIEIHQLEPGLTITDDGAERSVESGCIDITAREASVTTIIIELKAGSAGQRAVAQILSYMGDVANEDEGKKVRGFLWRPRSMPRRSRRPEWCRIFNSEKYSVRFLFSDG